MHPTHPFRTAPRRRRTSELDEVLAQAHTAITNARSERDEARSAAQQLHAENRRLKRALETERRAIPRVERPVPQTEQVPQAADADRLRELESELKTARRQRDTAREQARRDALAEVAEPLVGIVGQLGRALASNPDPDSDWFRGTAAVLARTRNAIQQLGLTIIDRVGVPFDPDQHDAVGTLETSQLEPDTIADVLEVGLRSADGTLVRAAKVLVARGEH